MMRHCRKKEQLAELYIKVPIIVYDGVPDPQKSFFEPNSLELSLSLLKEETRLHLKWESSLILYVIIK